MPRPKKIKEAAQATNALGAWIMPSFADESNDKDKDFAFAASRSRSETLNSPSQSYPNLDKFLTPFKTGSSSSYMDSRQAIRLCVKAYWAFPLLRNVVEVMGELSNSNIYLEGGNKNTRDFVTAWFERVNLWHLKEQFFREWFRSGNSFIYRFDAKIPESEAKKMTQVYGSSGKYTIPIKYVLMNPESILAGGDLMFGTPAYYKSLSSFEIAKLKAKDTDESKDFFNSLDPKTKKAINESAAAIEIPLDPKRLSPLLYKAQSYEAMGVPMAFGVINDIETKLEFKRIDLSIARTTERAMLLVNIGEPENEYNQGRNFNPAVADVIRNLFQNESVARTLITDHTVKAEWLIPDIGKILGAEKYEQLDKDINTGLNAILFDSGEKFANTSIKVQVFLERLKEARQAFLHNFLQPEIKRVCKAIGARVYPTAVFEDLSLKDELQYSKLAVSMAQLGFLAPDELFEAMKSGKMPTPETSLESQERFKEQRQNDLYLPLVGGASELTRRQVETADKVAKITAKQALQMPAAKAPGVAGRPTGTKSPKAATKPSPIGSSKASFSVKALTNLSNQVSLLHSKVDAAVKTKFKITETNATQAAVVKEIVAGIISNEEAANWDKCVASYVKKPKDSSEEVKKEIEDIQIEHDVDYYSAAILRLSSNELFD
jgi:hypothetical protein